MMSLSFRYPTNPISHLIIYRCKVPSFPVSSFPLFLCSQFPRFLYSIIPQFRISLFFPYLVSLFSIPHVVIGSVLLKRLSEAYLYKWLLPQFLISDTHSVVLPRRSSKAYLLNDFPVSRNSSFPKFLISSFPNFPHHQLLLLA